jgi:uncharacterized protein (TIGR02597 family)
MRILLPQKSLHRFAKLSVSASLLLCVGAAHAQSTVTVPVGAIHLNVPAQSDAFLSAVLARWAAYQGEVLSVTGATVTVKDAPAWDTGRFVRIAGTQPNTYFLRFASGAKRGDYFTISANGGDTVTLDLNGDDLTAINAGDKLEIIPYWTLATLFPAGQGFVASPTFTPVAMVLTSDVANAGINLSSPEAFFYYTGSLMGGPGWRKVGAAPTDTYDDLILPPDIPFKIRNTSTTPMRLANLGDVPMAGHSSILGTVAPSVSQDNATAIVAAADMTLAQSRLYESGAFVGSTSFIGLGRKDQLLVFDNNEQTGYNKAANATYYYYTGTNSGGPGWRRVGTTPTIKFDDVVVLKPGMAYVVRKASTPAPDSDYWRVTPAYAQ